MSKRDAISEIIRYNRGFDVESLRRKIEAMCKGTFEFFRATSQLFARDVKIPKDEPTGPIVCDLHSENFGAFRAVSNEIVYDINDFDDSTVGPYEYASRRRLTSLVVGGQAAVDQYQAALARFGKARKRRDLEALKSTADVKKLLTDFTASTMRIVSAAQDDAVLEALLRAFLKRGASSCRPSAAC